MAVILVVEQDAGYVNRIAASLRGDGFDVATASSRDEGLALAATRHPSLVLASGTLSGSRDLLGEFSRRRGGPGSVVILPVTLAEMSTPEQYQADDILTKPFSVDDLRALVERRLSGVESPGADEVSLAGADASTGAGEAPRASANKAPAIGSAPATGQLTSADIFGDVLAEVEAEAEDQPRESKAERQRADQAALDRRLEQTLSGVFPPAAEKKRPSAPRGRSGAPTVSEIDDLLDKTLSSLELPGRTKKRRTAEVTPLPPGADLPPTPETPLGPATDSHVAAASAGAPPAATPPPETPAAAAFQAPPTAPFESPGTEPIPDSDEVSAATVRIRIADLPTQPRQPEAPETTEPSGALADGGLPDEALFEPPPPLEEPLAIDAAAAATFEEPAPLEPDPFAPAPLEPATLEPAPFEPASFEPASFEPAPLESAVVEPPSASPTPDAATPAPPSFDDTGFDRTGWGVMDQAESPAALEPTPPPAAAATPTVQPPPVQPSAAALAATGSQDPAPQSASPKSLSPDQPPSDFSSAFQFDPPARIEGTRGGVVPSTAGPAETSLDSANETLDGVLQIRGHEVDGAADGEPFGDYRLLERVALGGMAEVWRARRRGVEGFQKTVAIKRILSHLTGSTDFVTMFIDEAKLAAQLTHGNIIQIYDLGKVGEDFFIAMEYVEGKDLRTLLTDARNRQQPLPAEQALVVIAAVARALDYAHRKRDFDNRDMGLVHRDVSPQNVLIGYEGEIKLCDFGIAKAVAKASTTQMGALKGKLQYMSPEQAWGKQVDARSDIFSLGSVLFEALTGTKLFQGDSEIGVLDAVRDCRVRSVLELDPNLPGAVDQIVAKALAKDPDDRYQTAGEMERDIVQVLESFQPTPTPSSVAEYMRSLYGTPAPPVAAAPAPEASPVTGASAATSEPSPTASGQLTVQGTQTGTGTGLRTGTYSDLDTPKKNRLPLILGALAVLALLAVLAFVFLRGGDDAGEAPSAAPPAATAPETRAAPAAAGAANPDAAVSEGSSAHGADADGADADGDGPDAGADGADADAADSSAVDPATDADARADGAGADGAGANGTADVQSLIDEELRNQREALERDFEAERRRIQREIERVQQAEEDDG